MTSTVELNMELPDGMITPSLARTAICSALGNSTASLKHDAALAISEVVTNAAIHAGGATKISAWSRLDSPRLRVEVRDSSTLVPVKRLATGDDIGGRGMSIVELVSSNYGSFPVTGGKVVWFELQ